MIPYNLMQAELKKIVSLVALVLACLAGAASSQTVTPPAPGTRPAPPALPSRTQAALPPGFAPRGTAEKSIQTDANVKLSLCVLTGKLTVNSWARNEVRMFVAGGSGFNFRVIQKDMASGKPIWLSADAVNGPKGRAMLPTECLAADEIEVDAPAGTALDVKGNQIVLTVDRLRRVNVETVSGGTQLRNISAGVSATVNQGNISVEDSKGSISVETTTGNILVFGAQPGEVGDTLKARTSSGNIVLNDLGHRQMEVNSISGSINYTGSILPGGDYRFGTTNGTVRLSLPGDTSCKISATYGFGSFSSDIPFKVETENVTAGAVKTVVGEVGAGGSSVIKVTTSSGSILLRKQ